MDNKEIEEFIESLRKSPEAPDDEFPPANLNEYVKELLEENNSLRLEIYKKNKKILKLSSDKTEAELKCMELQKEISELKKIKNHHVESKKRKLDDVITMSPINMKYEIIKSVKFVKVTNLGLDINNLNPVYGNIYLNVMKLQRSDFILYDFYKEIDHYLNINPQIEVIYLPKYNKFIVRDQSQYLSFIFVNLWNTRDDVDSNVVICKFLHDCKHQKFASPFKNNHCHFYHDWCDYSLIIPRDLDKYFKINSFQKLLHDKYLSKNKLYHISQEFSIMYARIKVLSAIFKCLSSDRSN